MKTILLNVLWLIMVSPLSLEAYSQITLNKTNNVEITLNCDQLSELAPPIAESTCEGDLQYSFEDKTYSGGCLGTIERIWVIRDNCNNSVSFQQFIRLTDDRAPRMSAYPTSISVAKDQIPKVPEITATDNCDKKVKVEFSEKEFKDDKGNITSINRTWKAVDKCGNIDSHVQTISIKSPQK
jgi:hypothetical protein